MCGIFVLVHCGLNRELSTDALVAGTRVVRHRGPDDEGYLIWREGQPPTVFAGDETAAPSRKALRLTTLPYRATWRVAFGHRRLSIVDLSPLGHQPMVHRAMGLALAYNGEIYNHHELRRELEAQGHHFESHSDTEVLLAAWAKWGSNCLARLNGMFAFALLDPRNGGALHIVRDRFGVKPLYRARVGDFLVFASEIKQIRALPGYVFRQNERALREYLVEARLDGSSETLHEGVQQVRAGERAVVDLSCASPQVKLTRWYDHIAETYRGAVADASVQFRELLADSVALRLRADVPVGSCLSGGLDSSAIVCLAHRILAEHDSHAGQVTVTARYSDERFDEWKYAEEVIRQTGATSISVWPNVEELERDLDRILWHMDEPFGSTSMFSQWSVFRAAAGAGLKVMLDGQGSDEQLAGYGGNDAALYTGYLRGGKLAHLIGEILSHRRRRGSIPTAQLLLALRNIVPAVDHFLPARVRRNRTRPWLRGDGHWDPAGAGRAAAPRSLGDSLRSQLFKTALPVLLRYEDRNSMAWSIESRVPFLDFRLVEFLASLPDHMKLRHGLTKVVLRTALAGILPEEVRKRRDKMGFVTPEEVWWLGTEKDWFRRQIEAAIDIAPDILNADATIKLLEDMQAGRTSFSFLPWRIACLGRWLTNGLASQMLPNGPSLPAEIGNTSGARART